MLRNFVWMLTIKNNCQKEVNIDKLEHEIYVLQRNQKFFNTVKKAIKDFEQSHEGDKKAWFNELCFCLLTANSGAKKVLDIWEDLCIDDAFIQFSLNELSAILKQKRL